MTKPRHRLQTWGWISIGTLCVLFGLLMLLVGWSDPGIRYGGLALILFLGVGMLGYAGGPLLGRRGSRPVLRSRVETSVGIEPAFTFSTLRARQLAPVVGNFGFVADAEAVIDAIHLYRDEPERRRAIGSEEELARLHRLRGLAGRT